MVNDSADSSGRSSMFAGRRSEKLGYQVPTVDSLLIGTTRGLVPTGRSDRRLGRSTIRESEAGVLLTK